MKICTFIVSYRFAIHFFFFTASIKNKTYSENGAIDEAAEPVVEHETAENGGENDAHDESALQEVLVLPDDDGALVKVGNVGSANALGVLLEDHPAHVGVEETLANGVGVLVGVGVSVVSTVVPRPPPDGAFNGSGTNGSEVDLERKACLVGLVRPETVITYCRDFVSKH